MRHLRTVVQVLSVTSLLLIATLLAGHLGHYLWVTRVGHRASFYDRLSGPARENYRHMSRSSVEALLASTWQPGWVYEPWTGFRERQRTSELVNVDASGLRSNRRGDRPLDRLDGAVWFFGGSTTFGYGVADHETIPAQAELLLGRPVVNFGRGYFYTAQENLLLQRYLGSGLVPSEVWFLDGINERCELRVYEKTMATLFERAQGGSRSDYLELVRPFAALVAPFTRHHAADDEAVRRTEETRDLGPCTRYGRTTSLTAVLASQLLERDAICRAHGVRCRTFVQPFPEAHIPHRGPELSSWERQLLRTMFERVSVAFREAGADFMTNAVADGADHAFVDGVHYGARANRAIAAAITARVRAGSGVGSPNRESRLPARQ